MLICSKPENEIVCFGRHFIATKSEATFFFSFKTILSLCKFVARFICFTTETWHDESLTFTPKHITFRRWLVKHRKLMFEKSKREKKQLRRDRRTTTQSVQCVHSLFVRALNLVVAPRSNLVDNDYVVCICHWSINGKINKIAMNYSTRTSWKLRRKWQTQATDERSEHVGRRWTQIDRECDVVKLPLGAHISLSTERHKRLECHKKWNLSNWKTWLY